MDYYGNSENDRMERNERWTITKIINTWVLVFLFLFLHIYRSDSELLQTNNNFCSLVLLAFRCNGDRFLVSPLPMLPILQLWSDGCHWWIGLRRKALIEKQYFFSSILWFLDGSVEIFLFFCKLWINIIGWVPLCNKVTSKCVTRTDKHAKFK